MERGARPEPDPRRLASEVAHDLGAALALIAGYADALRETLGSTAASGEVAASLDGIDRGVARLRAVSDRLATWGRSEGGL